MDPFTVEAHVRLDCNGKQPVVPINTIQLNFTFQISLTQGGAAMAGGVQAFRAGSLSELQSVAFVSTTVSPSFYCFRSSGPHDTR